jgi:hypothetical protein
MSEEEEPAVEPTDRVPSLVGPLVLAALMGVGAILIAIAAIWLIVR